MPRRRIVAIDPEDELRPSPRPRLSTLEWDDVIHIRPDFLLSPQEQLARKRQRAIRISSSEQSQLSRSTTWFLTQMDNLQDFLVTSSVAARTVAVKFPRFRPFATLIGGAADATSLGNITRSLKPARTAGKRHAENRLAQSPGYYRTRAKQARTFGQALPNVAESLQILQTSDQLAGVGLSLGALMATPLSVYDNYRELKRTLPTQEIPDELWKEYQEDPDKLWAIREKDYRAMENFVTSTAIAAYTTMKMPVAIGLGIAIDRLGRLIGPTTSQSRAALEEEKRAWEAAQGIAWGPDIFTPHEHLIIALATHLLFDKYSSSPGPTSFLALATPFLGTQVEAPVPRNPITREVLADLGYNPNDPGPLPMRGNPRRAPLRDYQAEAQETAPHVLTLWRDALFTEAQEAFAQGFVSHAARAPWPFLMGQDPGLQTEYADIGKAMLYVIEQDLPIQDNLSDDDLYAHLDRYAAAFHSDPGHKPSPELLAHLWSIITGHGGEQPV